ncbi:glycosyltransferase [Microbacterium maritypicum]|uniref:glycosyltransferase n=1 Tax=Microbacterium maritypicum TaxID=33918 RepID=UPI00381D0D15
MSDYAALVIGYRRPDLVRDVLARLDAQEVPCAQVIIVDNGGDLPDDVLTDVNGRPPVMIRRGDNPGYGAAVNLALEVCEQRGIENLLVLTHDAWFEEDLSARMLDAFDRLPDVGAAAPTLYWVSRPDVVFSAGGVLTKGGRAYHHVTAPASGTRDVDWVDGAVVMYRTRALRGIGGMEEMYFLYFEDVDTGWALRQHGWRTVVLDVRAAQEPGAHPLRLGVRNMALFARKAGLGRVRSSLALGRRAAEELIVGWRRTGRVPVGDAWAGWRDARAGRTGKIDD